MKIKLSNEMKITSKGAETNMIKKSLLTIVALMLAFVLSGGIVASAGTDTAWTERIDGDDRIDTAVEVSLEMYPKGSPIGPRYVIIARSDHYADALAGAGLVTDLFVTPVSVTYPRSTYDAAYTIPKNSVIPIANPILLTPSNSLDDRVADEIERLATVGLVEQVKGLSGSIINETTDVSVYVLGGKGAISESVLEEIEDITGVGDVERIGGDTRYETATLIDDEMAPGANYGHEVPTISTFIATGENFPDALSAAGYAASTRSPILLSKKNELTDDTRDALDHGNNDNTDSIIVGGTGVISNAVRDDLENVSDTVDRVAGDDRYATAVAFAEDVWGIEDVSNNRDDQRFVFARGDDFPDALAASGLVANIGTLNQVVGSLAPQLIKLTEPIPTLLTNTNSLNSETDDYLTEMFEDDAVDVLRESFVLGGTGAISDGTAEDIATALSDGEFESTEDKPEIDDSEVKINDVDEDDCDDNVARADCDETITITVGVKDIINDDSSTGKVTVDTRDLGEDNNSTYKEEFKLGLLACQGDDCAFRSTIEVETDDDDDDELNKDVTLEITATNQAGSDTADSEEFDIFN